MSIVICACGEWNAYHLMMVTYCQFHLKSDQGIKTLTNDEAAKKSPDYGQADLFNAVSGKMGLCLAGYVSGQFRGNADSGFVLC